MAPRVWKSLFLRGVCGISVLVSPMSFAFNQEILEQILEQSPDTLKFGLMACLSVLVFLLLLVIIFKLKLASARKKQTSHDKQIADKQALLNDFKVGMLHVYMAGEIIFANRVAAFFLGSKEDKLINRPLIDVFDEQAQESISTALASNQYAPMQTYVTVSKRHLHLGFNKQSDIQYGIASVISLADVSNYQHKIDQQAAHLNSLNQGLKQSGLARLTINFDDNSFTSNQLFADWLLASQPLSGDLSQFKKMLNNKTMCEWEQALDESKKQHQMDISCDFLVGDQNQADSIGSEPKEAQDEQTIPLRLIGLSR
ncbi:MAG: PAS domain-containing protein, partial [Paraglaciecola sp.]|nr:PAS domain-containing protein [Paraglaciecola sp.]